MLEIGEFTRDSIYTQTVKCGRRVGIRVCYRQKAYNKLKCKERRLLFYKRLKSQKRARRFID